MRIALYQPDIPQNAGTIIRLGACLGVPVDIIEPCGFVWSEPKLRRAGMDYLTMANVTRHENWSRFTGESNGRLLLLTTKAQQSYLEIDFQSDDRLLFGRESVGVPEEIHEAADVRLTIPMMPGARSLNVAMAAAMVTAEALRQTRGFPGSPPSSKETK